MTDKKKPYTALMRVEDELIDLTDKIDALDKYKAGKAYAKLSKGSQRLLRIQLLHMTDYAKTLVLRIKAW